MKYVVVFKYLCIFLWSGKSVFGWIYDVNYNYCGRLDTHTLRDEHGFALFNPLSTLGLS